MKKIYFILTALLAVFSITMRAETEVEAGVIYPITTFGTACDEMFITKEDVPVGKNVVVFYNANATTTFGNEFFYFGNNGASTAKSKTTETDSKGNRTIRYISKDGLSNGGKVKINLYQPDASCTSATWCYVICDASAASTVANPADEGGSATPDTPEAVPGQDENNAIALTNGVATSFTSINNGSNVIYLKFVAEMDGVATINMTEPTVFARWMEDGIMAYGKLKQNYFRNGNEFDVQKGKTYYIYYAFADATSASISYVITPDAEGTKRTSAIVVSANGMHYLIGKPHVGDDYFNTTTWFKIDGTALADKNVMTITIDGGNMSEVALFRNDDPGFIKRYLMGAGSGMLPVNSTVTFDIAPSAADYYVAIAQDDVNGTATFTFSTATAGETFGTAIETTVGHNDVKAGTWCRYTHSGDTKIVSVSTSSVVYDANEGLVAEGGDIASGFTMGNGQTIYFKSLVDGCDITLRDMERGETPDMPIVIELVNEGLGSFSITLNGSDSDVRRYALFTATSDGTFMYGTDNASVINMALGSSVRDITNPDATKAVSILQKHETAYGMFIYRWEVKEGHTYLIEQTLVNNLGTVNFLCSFAEAAEGDTEGKALAIHLNAPHDLGRSEAITKYLKYTASDSGDYLLSVLLTGNVRICGDNAHTVSRDYENGTDYHNELLHLDAGQTVVFSVTPSANIEHISSGVSDFFIPNYYAVITKAGDAHDGTQLLTALPLIADHAVLTGNNNTWFGPITVAADQTLSVVADLSASNSTNAAVIIANEQGQWYNLTSQVSSSVAGTKHIYTLAPTPESRTIYLMSNSFVPSKWHYTFANPNDEGTAIAGVHTDSSASAAIYSPSGTPLHSLRRGINIIINADGEVKKVMK